MFFKHMMLGNLFPPQGSLVPLDRGWQICEDANSVGDKSRSSRWDKIGKIVNTSGWKVDAQSGNTLSKLQKDTGGLANTSLLVAKLNVLVYISLFWKSVGDTKTLFPTSALPFVRWASLICRRTYCADQGFSNRLSGFQRQTCSRVYWLETHAQLNRLDYHRQQQRSLEPSGGSPKISWNQETVEWYPIKCPTTKCEQK